LKIVSTNSGAIICGQSASQTAFGTPYGLDDVVLLTVDEMGEMDWSTLIGGSHTDHLRDMLPPSFYLVGGDSGWESVVFLTGYTFSDDGDLQAFDDNYQEENAWVVAFELGDKQIVDAGLFGGNDEDQINALVRNPINNLFVTCAGFTKSIDGDLGKHGAHDGWVFNVDYYGEGIGIEDEANFELNIAPNPVQEILWIETSLETFTFQLYDLNGRVRHSSSEQLNIFGPTSLDVAAFPVGMYLLELCGDAGCTTRKVVKQ